MSYDIRNVASAFSGNTYARVCARKVCMYVCGRRKLDDQGKVPAKRAKSGEINTALPSVAKNLKFPQACAQQSTCINKAAREFYEQEPPLVLFAIDLLIPFLPMYAGSAGRVVSIIVYAIAFVRGHSRRKIPSII